MSSTADKTEKPSAKKQRDAHKEGRVARSRDLSMAVSSLAVTIALTRFGPGIVAQLGTHLIRGLARIGQHPVADITVRDMSSIVFSDGYVFLMVVGPLLGVAAVAGLFGNVAQSGLVFAPLKLDFNRLSPSQGLSRLAPKQSGIDLVKMLIAVTALSYLSVKVCRQLLAGAPQLSWLSPVDSARFGWGLLIGLMWQAAFTMLFIAMFDYGVQRWRLWTSMKMTKQEVRDEGKSQDANPEVKARVRKIQREMTRSRMLKNVKTATVVVTNPTHYAVALEYNRAKSAAPIVVAKGKDLLAARIRKIAREAGVPIVENVSLAQALFAGAEVGDAIPGALFGAVAEVLAYLVRIKQLML